MQLIWYQNLYETLQNRIEGTLPNVSQKLALMICFHLRHTARQIREILGCLSTSGALGERVHGEELLRDFNRRPILNRSAYRPLQPC